MRKLYEQMHQKKKTICICETKSADQLFSNWVGEQAGLCRTCSEPKIVVFLARRLMCSIFSLNIVSPIDCYVCHSTNDDCGENINAESLVSRGAKESGCNSCTKIFSFHGTSKSIIFLLIVCMGQNMNILTFSFELT